MRVKRNRLLLVFFFHVLSVFYLFSGEPPKEPILRVETGMHTARINQIGIDEGEQFLVTGSHDKTVRVWDLRTGKPLQVLRPPIGKGDDGKIYAVAISPDGNHIACGGWTGDEWDGDHSILIFDRQTETIHRRVTGLPNVISHLSYSKDGKRLAASLGGSNGIRIYGTDGYEGTAKDTEYGNSCLWCDWDGTGRLATACDDGYIRLYNTNFERMAKKKAPGGKEPFSTCFSPDGSRIAVGFSNSTAVNVLSGNDLSLLYAPETASINNGDISSVCWSLDGRRLFAGGEYHRGGKFPIVMWEVMEKGTHKYYEASENTIMHILPLQNRDIVFGSFDPAFGRIDRNGKTVFNQSYYIADLRGLLSKFTASPCGSQIKFGYKEWGEQPALFSINLRSLEINPKTLPTMMSPITAAKNLRISDWEDSYSPKLNGKELSLRKGERCRSLSIAPGGKTFLLGTGWYLRYFDDTGKEKWNIPAPSTAWAVNIPRDREVAVAAFGDGTIRWYRLRDGEELLAFFPHNDRKRWVMWTPSGYYDASPGGEDLIGWHLNQGKDQAAEFFPASRFRSVYYRPDVVSRVLDTLDEKKALVLADTENRKKATHLADLRKKLPPKVRIVFPIDGETVYSNTVKVKYAVRTPSGEPVTGIEVKVDGRPVAEPKGIGVVDKAKYGVIRVPVPPEDCEISVFASNRYSTSEAATVRVKWYARKPGIMRPNLYILAVGVSRYRDKSLTLDYSGKDARDFAAVMKKQENLLYENIETRVLDDELATKDNILDGLEWLEKQVTSRDVSMVFISGHGLTDHKNSYYFLPADIDLDSLKRTGVGWFDIRETVSNAAGKSILFLDTCHSGNIYGKEKRRRPADMNAIINELTSADNGVVVFTATTTRQSALEKSEWKNGAFTRALIDGIGGEAALMNEKAITVTMLGTYLARQVKKLTGGKQSPGIIKPETVPDFPVAIKKRL